MDYSDQYYNEAFDRFCNHCELNPKSKHVQDIFYALYEYGGWAELKINFTKMEEAALNNEDELLETLIDDYHKEMSID